MQNKKLMTSTTDSVVKTKKSKTPEKKEAPEKNSPKQTEKKEDLESKDQQAQPNIDLQEDSIISNIINYEELEKYQ